MVERDVRPDAHKRGPFVNGAMLVGMGCATSVVVTGYCYNSPLIYFDGLFAWLILLVIGKILWARRGKLQLVANTVILFIVALPLADLFHAHREEPPPTPGPESGTTNRCYSFELAQGDPAQFRNWWKAYIREWLKIRHHVEAPGPGHEVAFRLKPNTEVRFFSSTYKINSLGFRDQEFGREKTNQFRIVALGGSTTMGMTMEPEDVPWPDALEQLIVRRLRPSRPVEVINAGVWAYTLEDNLTRLDREIGPLRPDLIISYHGYNGFRFLDQSLAPFQVGPPPFSHERPSALLAACEHRLRQWWHRRRLTRRSLQPVDPERLRGAVLDSRYADLYRDLISWCESRRVGLALCTFNLAVNEQSPREVVRFYEGGFPNVHLDIKANRLHNYLVSSLAAGTESPLLIDASKGLDGVWARYVDLMHFTQEGRNQLAENIFTGLKPLLTRRLQVASRD